MRKLILSLIFPVFAIMIFFSIEPSLDSSASQETVLKLSRMYQPTFNEGSPIVFQGRLDTASGHPIPKAEILIKNDGPCPADLIIGSGTTDKKGKFWIKIPAQIWDERDNLIVANAHFEGDQQFSPAISGNQKIVVYPVKGISCEG